MLSSAHLAVGLNDPYPWLVPGQKPRGSGKTHTVRPASGDHSRFRFFSILTISPLPGSAFHRGIPNAPTELMFVKEEQGAGWPNLGDRKAAEPTPRTTWA